MSDTRTKIITAATEILLDGGDSSPSVRAVAARAGVGASTLRHHFRTQHDLMDAVITGIYADAWPDERITDATVPARERLIECLMGLLTPLGDAEQARQAWRRIFQTFFEAGPAGEAGYAAIVRLSHGRVQGWLDLLRDEGSLPAGDQRLRAHYLLVVIDGLAVDRTLVDAGLQGDDEARILGTAVDAVFQLAW